MGFGRVFGQNGQNQDFAHIEKTAYVPIHLQFCQNILDCEVGEIVHMLYIMFFLPSGLGVRPPDPIRPRSIGRGRIKWWSHLTLSLDSTPGDALSPVTVPASPALGSPSWSIRRPRGLGRAGAVAAVTNEGNRHGPRGTRRRSKQQESLLGICWNP